MEAKARSLTFLGNVHEVVVPYFQRSYVWDEDNWRELFVAMLRTDRPHFLGSIILKQSADVVPTGDVRRVNVIDGQQRLTTLCILLRALHDSFSTEIQGNISAQIETYLFFKPDPMLASRQVKILHSRLDTEDYTNVIRGDFANDMSGITRTCSNILRCYRFFREEIAKCKEKEAEGLFKRLINPSHEIVVVIDLAAADDEQAIFDTINSAGVHLSSADIIKNALFRRMQSLIGTKAGIVYDSTWKQAFESDDETRKFWAKERSVGRLMRDNLEILLHAIAVIEKFFDPEKETLTDLADRYKEHIATCDAEMLNAVLKRLGVYASLYRDRVCDYQQQISYADPEARLLHILDHLEISTLHPYILHLMYECKNDHKALHTAFAAIERLVMTRTICGKENKSLNKRCKQFIFDPQAIDRVNVEISDDQLVQSLDRMSNSTAAITLFWVELLRRHQDKLRSEQSLVFSHTLEHVIPQKWVEYWGVVPIVDYKGTPITDPTTAEATRNHAVYRLGNMTLLNGKLNTSISNQPFAIKISGRGRNRGIRNYSDMSITRDDILLPFDAGKITWDEQRIQERTALLAKEVLRLWGTASLVSASSQEPTASAGA